MLELLLDDLCAFFVVVFFKCRDVEAHHLFLILYFWPIPASENLSERLLRLRSTSFPLTLSLDAALTAWRLTLV